MIIAFNIALASAKSEAHTVVVKSDGDRIEWRYRDSGTVKAKPDWGARPAGYRFTCDEGSTAEVCGVRIQVADKGKF